MPRTPPPLPGIEPPVPLKYTLRSPSPPIGEKRKGGPRRVWLKQLPRADYKPGGYEVTRTEKRVFNTSPYSGRIKQLWKFKGEDEADMSCIEIYAIFEAYREKSDFVGMDVCRKYIQMGRTRSLRYALRPGGRKYEKDEKGNKVEIPRTGQVHDESKMRGARIYQDYEERIWADKTYKRLWVHFGGKEFRFKRTIREDADEENEPVGRPGSEKAAGEGEEDDGPVAKRQKGNPGITPKKGAKARGRKQKAAEKEDEPEEESNGLRRSKRKSMT